MKEEMIGFKVTKQEKEALLAQAKTQGITVSTLVREKVVSIELDADFLKSLFLFNMYKGHPLGREAHREVRFMISCFKKAHLKLNPEQKRVVLKLHSAVEEVNISLESDPTKEYELSNPYDQRFEQIIWEHFVGLGEEAGHE